LRTQVIDPFSDPRWLRFVRETPGATVYHSPSWLRLLTETYGYKPFCLAALEGEDIVGVLPLLEVRSRLTGRRSVCLPFSDECGPLSVTAEAVAGLIRAAEGMRKTLNWGRVEIRSSVDLPGLTVASRFKGHVRVLETDAEKVFRSFRKSQTQQPIRRAENAGVLVERRTDLEAMREFIRLNALTRRKHGVPPQPDEFFWNLQRGILKTGLGFIGTASHGGRIVAASVFLHWRETLFHKYGASDERKLDCRPNHAILWDAIRWGCEQGYTRFDFGRTELDNPGLIQFKAGWGGEERDLWYVQIGGESKSDSGGGIQALKPLVTRLPIPLLKFIGRKLYGHIG
jgi:CelD/BcsL family acetyltransferase involved in cellulose biosynthesis